MCHESSGDILGSDLIRNLKSKDPSIEFFGLGGSEMRKEGFNSFDSNEELQVMGLIDPIFRINRILKKRNELIDHLIDKNIDIFIGIDSPSLNLGISRILKKSLISKQYSMFVLRFGHGDQTELKNLMIF